ncbi:IS66 family insertion sequence element accessory protein TnpB [Bacillus sp. 03113]|uniref:IS66 family insertion sequence element accessory protein TnpB n=1 Tax=Bacillus sp. 03113 TaxID=2578211 RepID=UPI00215B9976|nr:IS66 family insertion sequence element accessory protein TnpB [Bacillus sp. 03113]
MSQQKLTIIPVTLHSENKVSFTATSSPTSSNNACTIKTANAEISFFNGVHHPNGHEGVETSVKYDYTSVKNIYIICGKTDMRKGIDGLATLIQDSFELDPYGDSIFLLSGWSKDRYKCLYFDGDGFAMLYKRI